MNLTEEQRKQVTEWISQGAKLAEVQSRLNQEFGLRLTYMETRFLVDDLKLTPKDPEPKKTEPPPTPDKGAAEEKKTADDPARPGKVSVGVDQIARPGALASGKVTFSDGQTAEWYLDQMGRLGVVPAKQGYKPPAADVQEFQTALQDQLQRLGI